MSFWYEAAIILGGGFFLFVIWSVSIGPLRRDRLRQARLLRELIIAGYQIPKGSVITQNKDGGTLVFTILQGQYSYGLHRPNDTGWKVYHHGIEDGSWTVIKSETFNRELAIHLTAVNGRLMMIGQPQLELEFLDKPEYTELQFFYEKLRGRDPDAVLASAPQQ
ncbi:MAG TPA: hypothetical protein VFP32_03990 [Candidatus Saccharimonadales bacterium]|nr:hypothetical protein [Candidatus Saccharimonadales bacterium]